MALFNVAGSLDWEVTEVGEELCQNFNQIFSNKKTKRRNKHKSVIKNSDSYNSHSRNSIELSDSRKLFNRSDLPHNGQSTVILNRATEMRNNKLLKKLKNKLKKHSSSEDKTPLNCSSVNDNISVAKDFGNKKGLKRKRMLPLEEDNHLPKKAKTTFANAYENHDSSLKLKKKKKKKKTEFLNEYIESEESALAKYDMKKKHKKNDLQVISDNPQSTKAIKTIDKKDVVKVQHNIDPKIVKKRKKQLEQLKQLITEKEQGSAPKKEAPILTLRQKMMRKLKAARFRFLNEQIYSTTSKETEKIFRQDPEAFKAYHEGYKLQVKRWPLNPLDKIIKSINKMNKSLVVADFGCGEARLAKSVEQKVHSFDLVAVNDTVIPCDMAQVPLEDCAVDVAVFCLSLMGTNLKDYLIEANRVLKKGGLLKIAEVESRFDDVDAFVKSCEQFGFKKTWMDLSYNLFYFIDFRKERSVKDKKKLPSISLQPCLYKKR